MLKFINSTCDLINLNDILVICKHINMGVDILKIYEITEFFGLPIAKMNIIIMDFFWDH